MQSFIMSQFSDNPLTWMLHNRNGNSKINRIQERAFRIAHKDFNSSYEELLAKNNSVTIHQKSLQLLMVEIYKIKNIWIPVFMKSIFKENSHHYKLRPMNTLKLTKVKTVLYGRDTVRHMGKNIWDSLANDIKNTETLAAFKRRMNNWKCQDCSCRLCKLYIQYFGYL